MKLWFWLHAMDVLLWCEARCHLAYMRALKRASDATDWGES